MSNRDDRIQRTLAIGLALLMIATAVAPTAAGTSETDNEAPGFVCVIVDPGGPSVGVDPGCDGKDVIVVNGTDGASNIEK